MNLAIIPARKSSKRIKNKNIINFFNEPIIVKTLKQIKKTKIFDKIIVTSDSNKILKISKKYGAETFLRKKNLSGDKVPVLKVINDVLKNIKLKVNYVFYFYPTSVFIKKKYLAESIKILKKNKNTMILSICEFPHPVERSLIMNSKNEIKFKNLKNKNKQTQFFQKSFYDVGQFGGATKEYFLKKNTNSKKIKGYILKDYEACDIDNPEDIEKAKFLFRNIK
jgi:pseudaminic acid cytidylyltransferase